jgi:hypothetical protein
MPVRAFSGKYPNCDVGYGGVWLGERFWNGVAILTRECDPVARLLAFVTGLVNQELLLCDGYLAAENRVLRAHLPSRLRLSDAERSTLAEIARVAQPGHVWPGIGDWWPGSLMGPDGGGVRDASGLTGSGDAGGPICTRRRAVHQMSF